MRLKNSQMLTTNGCIVTNYGCIVTNFCVTTLIINQLTEKTCIYDVNYIKDLPNPHFYRLFINQNTKKK